MVDGPREAPRSGPAVSAGIINYNGAAFLKGCVGSLLAQDYPPTEILVFDNHSTDHSAASLREAFPEVRLIEGGRNLGYAGAANVVVKETASPYLLLLNPDVVLTPSFVGELVGAAERLPDAGSLSGKLARFPQRVGRLMIDSTGHVLFRNRFADNRGAGEEDLGQYDLPGEVFGVSGAAPFYRRAMLDDVRLGDEYFAADFFLYLEDVDLDWRARLGGWRSYYVPSAMAYHARGSRGSDDPAPRRDVSVLRYSLRNRYLMMARNEAMADLVRDAGAIIPTELLRFLDLLMTAPRALPGYLDTLRLFPRALRHRRAIRSRVRVSSEEIRRWLRPYPYRARIRERAVSLLRRMAS